MFGDRILTAISWLLPGFVIFIFGYYLPADTTLWIFGALSVAFGVWGFLIHGGPQVTAAGMFSGASAVFIGYAALWWHDFLDGRVPPELVAVTQAAYFSTVLMYMVFWWDTRAPLPLAERDPSTARWATTLGMLLTAGALSLHTVAPEGFAHYAENAAFVGIVIFSLGLTGSRGSVSVFGPRALLAAALVVWFVLVTFEGFGRLSVLALGGAVGIVFSARQRTRVIKLVALAAVPVAALGLTALRSQQLNATPAVAATGPDSDVSGLWTFARLTTMPDLSLSWGDTFWAAATIWIPRDLWPTKPLGLGAELTAVLSPELMSVGHSMVATAFGEWFWNFGWWGMLLMVVFVGWAVRWLDQRRSIVTGPLVSRRELLVGALVVAAIATLTDFVWSGSHTFAARMLLRTGILLVLIVVLGRSAEGSHSGTQSDSAEAGPPPGSPPEVSTRPAVRITATRASASHPDPARPAGTKAPEPPQV